MSDRNPIDIFLPGTTLCAEQLFGVLNHVTATGPSSERRISELEDALHDAIRALSSRGLIAAADRAKFALENKA